MVILSHSPMELHENHDAAMMLTTNEPCESWEATLYVDVHGDMYTEYAYVDWRELQRRRQVQRIRRILEGA